MNNKVKICLYLSVLIVLVGCKSKTYNKDLLKKQDIAPKTLKELSKEIDSIMMSVGDIERIILDIEGKEDKENKKESEGEQKEEAPKDESGKETNGDQAKDKSISTQETKEPSKEDDKIKSESEKEDIKTEKLEGKWKKIDVKIEKVYSLWNEYQVKGVKKGATAENSKDVEMALNKLVKGIEDRQTLTVYNYGSKSLNALEAFYAFYQDEIGGEVLALKYMVYQYYINAVKGSNSTAKIYIDNSEEYLNKIRLKLEDKKDEKEKIDRISFTFKSLSDALEEDSRRIFILKKDILVENLNSLEN